MDFFDLFKKDISELWEDHRWFLIIFGVFLIVIKFRDLILDLLISGAQNEMKQTEKKDGQLKAIQDNANAEANQSVQDANQIGKNDAPVDSDWYKKNE